MGKKVNELDIHITKAIITSISIKLNQDKGIPEFEVSGDLLSAQGVRVSSFSFSTNAWNDTNKFEAPLSLLSPAKDMFQFLQPVIMQRINGVFKELPANIEKVDSVPDDISF